MKDNIIQLEQIIESYCVRLEYVAESEWNNKPLPEKWSKKELLGHLVDSAQNNARRFIVALYEDSPVILYQQNNWVKICDYQNYAIHDLINLWKLLNKHICIILKNLGPGMENKLCVTDIPHTIEWVAADYNKHLLHHLHQILDLDPMPYSSN